LNGTWSWNTIASNINQVAKEAVNPECPEGYPKEVEHANRGLA